MRNSSVPTRSTLLAFRNWLIVWVLRAADIFVHMLRAEPATQRRHSARFRKLKRGLAVSCARFVMPQSGYWNEGLGKRTYTSQTRGYGAWIARWSLNISIGLRASPTQALTPNSSLGG